MDMYKILSFFSLCFFSLFGLTLVLSSVILRVLRNKNTKDGPKDLKLLFCDKEFLIDKGVKVRYLLRVVLIMSLMLSIISISVLEFLYT